MTFRLTPLNIVTSLSMVLLAMSYFGYSSDGSFQQEGIKPLYRMLLASMVLVSIITDFIFRFLFKQLKRIWIVELIFISLTVVIFLLLQK